MARNLNFAVEESWHYSNEPAFASTFGRLYTWAAAQEACPEGWRLPTESEMESLIEFLGGYAHAYRALISEGSTGFDAQLGGWYNPLQDKFYRLGLVGLYWTSTEVDSDNAMRYRFYSDCLVLLPNPMPKHQAYSCRCVRES